VLCGGESAPTAPVLTLPLTPDPEGLGQRLRQNWPHLAGYAAFRLAAADLGHVPDMLKGPLWVRALDEQGGVVEETGLQIPGVLDDLYLCTGPLGVVYRRDVPSLAV
jgi:pullulanase